MSCKVSVIVPAYNCESLVGKAIQSILEQTHKNLEVLIADDYSSDRTRAVIDSFTDRRIVKLHNTTNIGYLRTVNHLFKHATGEYICFQDADDWSASCRIEKQLGAIHNKSIDACGTGIYYTSFKGAIRNRVAYPSGLEKIRQCIMHGRPAVCYASILFSKSVLNSIGGYREFFSAGAEDVDWLLRLSEKHTFTNIPEPLYYYRFSPTSITQSTSIIELKASLQIARELALRRRNNHYDDLSMGDQESLLVEWQRACTKLRKTALSEDIYKINMLLRRRSYTSTMRVCTELLRKQAPVSGKLAVILSTLLKLALGIDNYSRIKHHLVNISHNSG